jgi:hypothetical protein
MDDTRGQFEVIVPDSRLAGDYALRLREALGVLEVFENRSAVYIAEDVLLRLADTLQVRVVADESSDGTIPIDDGVRLVESARNLVVSAACATVEPRLFYVGKKFAEAKEYVGGVRLGQSRRGSYIVTVISPLLTKPPETAAPRLFETEHLPFQRRVMLTLAGALAAAKTAAATADDDNLQAAFWPQVMSGVSANLCDAIAGLLGSTRSVQRAEVTLSWSPESPPALPPGSEFVFKKEEVAVYEDAARVLREEAPQTGFLVFGQVVGLHRPEGALRGRVTIAGLVDQKAHLIDVTLGEEDYDIAILAHRQKLAVVCNGELVKSGRTHVLRNPRDFALNEDYSH